MQEDTINRCLQELFARQGLELETWNLSQLSSDSPDFIVEPRRQVVNSERDNDDGGDHLRPARSVSSIIFGSVFGSDSDPCAPSTPQTAHEESCTFDSCR